MTLDYGYRSKCCYAPIRFGFKENKKTGIRRQVMICCRCKKRDIDIIPTDQAEALIEKAEHLASSLDI